MLLNKETAVGGLVQELNRWLKVKWLHADYNKQLPNARMFSITSNGYSSPPSGNTVVQSAMHTQTSTRSWGKEQPDQCCDFDTLTLLDTSVQGMTWFFSLGWVESKSLSLCSIWTSSTLHWMTTPVRQSRVFPAMMTLKPNS